MNSARTAIEMKTIENHLLMLISKTVCQVHFGVVRVLIKFVNSHGRLGSAFTSESTDCMDANNRINICAFEPCMPRISIVELMKSSVINAPIVGVSRTCVLFVSACEPCKTYAY